MLVEISAVPPIHCCDSTPALSQGLIPLAALKWLMKMAGGLLCLCVMQLITLCLTWLWFQPTVLRLCDCSVANITTDPNDRLKLVTEQGAAGGGYVVCLVGCALKNIYIHIKILLPHENKMIGASIAFVATSCQTLQRLLQNTRLWPMFDRCISGYAGRSSVVSSDSQNWNWISWKIQSYYRSHMCQSRKNKIKAAACYWALY